MVHGLTSYNPATAGATAAQKKFSNLELIAQNSSF
jgi:hypothetical protein